MTCCAQAARLSARAMERPRADPPPASHCRLHGASKLIRSSTATRDDRPGRQTTPPLAPASRAWAFSPKHSEPGVLSAESGRRLSEGTSTRPLQANRILPCAPHSSHRTVALQRRTVPFRRCSHNVGGPLEARARWFAAGYFPGFGGPTRSHVRPDSCVGGNGVSPDSMVTCLACATSPPRGPRSMYSPGLSGCSPGFCVVTTTPSLDPT
jgi:hypothetical protein